MRRVLAASATLFIALGASGHAFAWGAQGHRYIGNIAWALLSDNAKGQASALLGHDEHGNPISLATAAVWPDCIRSVKDKGGGVFEYEAGGGAAACAVFAGVAADKAEMEDFAKRNWTTCEYAHHLKECHRSFHFADVAIQHGRYQVGYYGTGKQDVVAGIRAAILVLEGQPPEAPFDIQDKREALFLLAHFVGDAHQPLHVGSIYLNASGHRVNPDTTPGSHVANETAGGNWLHFGSKELHGDWDTVDAGPEADHDAICAAAAVQPVAGALLDKPVRWASESVLAAKQTAFRNVSFSGAAPGSWNMTFQDRNQYISDRKTVQEKRLVLGAARLAEVLNGIWPGVKPALACP